MPAVHFTQAAPVYTPNDTVAFEMVVDGTTAPCEISAEALQDHFGARSHAGPDLVAAATRSKAVIEGVAKLKAPVRLAREDLNKSTDHAAAR